MKLIKDKDGFQLYKAESMKDVTYIYKNVGHSCMRIYAGKVRPFKSTPKYLSMSFLNFIGVYPVHFYCMNSVSNLYLIKQDKRNIARFVATYKDVHAVYLDKSRGKANSESHVWKFLKQSGFDGKKPKLDYVKVKPIKIIFKDKKYNILTAPWFDANSYPWVKYIPKYEVFYVCRTKRKGYISFYSISAGSRFVTSNEVLTGLPDRRLRGLLL